MPTSAGTGSEVTPFAVITDETTGVKYPLADYELLPNMAIVDAELDDERAQGADGHPGIDALTHALEAYASVMATDYTDELAMEAAKMVFKICRAAITTAPRIPRPVNKCPMRRPWPAWRSQTRSSASATRWRTSSAYSIVPHGLANAMLICEVIRFNAADFPPKKGTFPQYKYPHTKARYAKVAITSAWKGATTLNGLRI